MAGYNYKMHEEIIDKHINHGYSTRLLAQEYGFGTRSGDSGRPPVAAESYHLDPNIVEKDYWVTFALYNIKNKNVFDNYTQTAPDTI